MTNKLVRPLTVFLLFAAFFASVYAEDATKNRRQSLSKINGVPSSTRFNINNISTWIYNDGMADNNNLGNSGFVYPKGSNKASFYMSGFVWGGKIDGEVRVGGSTYQSGLTPGAIKNGAQEDSLAPNVRIYRVRRDYKTGSLSAEVRDLEGSEAAVKAQYQKDWEEWPAADGAPFEDVDGDGQYNPQVDVPGVKGADQTIWYVNNDLKASKTTWLYGSSPMGIECQTTIWGYSTAGPLGSTLFKKYKLINKGQKNITEMHVSVWSDPDLGDAQDDFAGCDTTLNLGYIYNASNSDAIYGANPPATGFGLLQGPLVKGTVSDTGIFNNKKILGYKNLPMTAFYYHVNSTAVNADPTIGPDYSRGTMRFWNLLHGRVSTSGAPFSYPPSLGQGTTLYPLSGDPVGRTGYLDGELYPKGDRRIGLASGPFTLAPGDTQEVVYAQIAAGGPGTGLNNLSAVTMLKNYLKVVQKSYMDQIDNPTVTQNSPAVNVAELDKQIIFDWGSNAAYVAETESFNQKGFRFQGYNVYQLPRADAAKSESKRIATYDIVDDIKVILGDVVDPETGIILKAIQQIGNDTGIKRTIKIDKDYIKNEPLVNGQEYYYAVTAYSYNPDPLAVPNNLENPFTPIKAVPRAPEPGMGYPTAYGDTVSVIKTGGKSDGKVVALVVNPKAVTGHKYEVSFNYNDEARTYKWKVTDLNTGAIKIKDQTNQTGDDAYLTVDGLLIKVIGVALSMKTHDMYDSPATPESAWGWKVLKGERRWTWAGANLVLEGFRGAMGSGATWLGTTVTELKNIKLILAATDSLGNVLNQNDPNVSFAYRYLRGATAAAAKQEFTPYIINKTSGYAFQDFKKNFPFAAYDVEDSLNPKRLAVGYLENNASGGLVDGKYWPPVKDVDNISTTSPREWFFIFDVPYSEIQNSALTGDLFSGNFPTLIQGTPNRYSGNKWPGGDELGIYVNHINTDKDMFTIQSDKLTLVNSESMPLSYELLQNYPNPFNPVTNIRYTLSEASHVELKVFDILGREVMTLVNMEQNAGRYNVQFDGKNLSSGIYIYRLSSKNFTKSNKMVLLK